MTFHRMWRSTGEHRPISLHDAAVWYVRAAEPQRDTWEVEGDLENGLILETPSALLGGDVRAMEQRRRELMREVAA